MRSTAIKLALTVVGMVLSVLLLRWTHWGGGFVTFIIAFLLSVLYGLDLGRELRNAPNPSPLQRLAGLVFGVPQALLGLVCIGAGGLIVVWVLYNSLVERLPDYSGSFLSFGLGPALIGVGYVWLRSAFVRDAKADLSPEEDPN